jgi:hypothetical protein
MYISLGIRIFLDKNFIGLFLFEDAVHNLRQKRCRELQQSVTPDQFFTKTLKKWRHISIEP